jgi:three-Cys-motif partner protein
MLENINFEPDKLGSWSEIKLEIIKRYSEEYARIVNNNNLISCYIDAFSGSGIHTSKTNNSITIDGSPVNAFNLQNKFREYYFIDLDKDKIEHLKNTLGMKDGVFYFNDDCNKVLLEQILPKMKFETFRRALCILDPYSLQFDWNILKMASESKIMEVFINFPIMDINRNVLIPNPTQKNIDKMNYFWGDNSWEKLSLVEQQSLFSDTTYKEKGITNIRLVEAYKKKLKNNFKFVPEPIAMKNGINRDIYFLFFASQNATGYKIAKFLLDKYRGKK